MGILAHRLHICICVAVGIHRDASILSVSSESPSTGSASTRLYQSNSMWVVDY